MSSNPCSKCGQIGIWMCSDRLCPDRVKHADARRPYVTGDAVFADGEWEAKRREELEKERYAAAMEAYSKGENG